MKPSAQLTPLQSRPTADLLLDAARRLGARVLTVPTIGRGRARIEIDYGAFSSVAAEMWTAMVHCQREDMAKPGRPERIGVGATPLEALRDLVDQLVVDVRAEYPRDAALIDLGLAALGASS
jgi:hypothetical protein